MLEISIPAGSKKSFIKAMSSNADSIYFGLKEFENMRSSENCFHTKDIINILIKYKKSNKKNFTKKSNKKNNSNKKFYITLNSIVNDSFLKENIPKLSKIIRVFDGIIISDIGLLEYINNSKKYKHLFKNIKKIISVQNESCNIESIKILKELGADRIVFERSMSLKEIKLIKKQLDTDKINIELEIFAFGPLCNCYDSLCFLGNFFENKACANYCMRSFNGNRILWNGFLDMSNNLSEIIESGINAIKIEGRTRSSYYIKNITNVFDAKRNEYYNYKKPKSFTPKQDKNTIKNQNRLLNNLALGFPRSTGQYLSNETFSINQKFTFENKYLYLIELLRLLKEGTLKDFITKLKLAINVDIKKKHNIKNGK